MIMHLDPTYIIYDGQLSHSQIAKQAATAVAVHITSSGPVLSKTPPTTNMATAWVKTTIRQPHNPRSRRTAVTVATTSRLL
jgi:hypothetical protein